MNDRTSTNRGWSDEVAGAAKGSRRGLALFGAIVLLVALIPLGRPAGHFEERLGDVLAQSPLIALPQATSMHSGDVVDHDVALLIDVSRSMAGDKLEAMRETGAALLDALFLDRGRDAGFRLALIPFSARVHAGPWLGDQGWVTSDQALGDRELACVEEPDGDPVALSGTPRAIAWQPSRKLPLTGWRRRGDEWIYGQVRMDAPCPAPLVDLHDNPARAAARLQELQAAGTARPDLALHWGWRVLSPRWQGVAARPQTSAAAPSRPRKTLVMITDGQISLSYSRLMRREARALFAEACRGAKAAGIEIVMVAFMAKAAEETALRRCASSGRFFEVRSPQQLSSLATELASAINLPARRPMAAAINAPNRQ